MRILGISAGNKEAGVALVEDGQVRLALLQERVSRVHKDSALPIAALRALLDGAGCTLDDLDGVAGNVSWAQLRAAFALPPKPAPRMPADPQADRHGLHHLCHAAFAYYTSGFDRALVVTVDNSGDNDTLVAYAAEHGQLRRLLALAPEPVAIGGVYESVTRQLGFGEYGEGKVTGLAGYGHADEAMARALLRADDAQVAVHSDYLGDWRHGLHGILRPRWQPWQQAHADLAASLQVAFADTLITLLQRLRALWPADALCLGGGVALNCGVNGEIARRGGFGRVYVPPSPADPGNAIGAALLWHARVAPWQLRPQWQTAGLGPVADRRATGDWLAAQGLAVRDCGAAGLSGLGEAVAGDLQDFGMVGFVWGGSEFGPRALGRRSLLGDPRRADVRDRLNDAKLRERWRPVAPAVMAEHAGDWLVNPVDSPFMLFAQLARPELVAAAAACVHVDGTTRAQSVHAAAEPALHAVLTAWLRRTGLPVVLNTSFNQASEPMVETVRDALDCAQRCGIEVLYADGWRVCLPPAAVQVPARPDRRVALAGELPTAWRGELVRQTAVELAAALSPSPATDQLCGVDDADGLVVLHLAGDEALRRAYAQGDRTVLTVTAPDVQALAVCHDDRLTIVPALLGSVGMRAVRRNLTPVRMGRPRSLRLSLPAEPTPFDTDTTSCNRWARGAARLREGLIAGCWLAGAETIDNLRIAGELGRWIATARVGDCELVVELAADITRPALIVSTDRGAVELDANGGFVLRVARPHTTDEVRQLNTDRGLGPLWTDVARWRRGEACEGSVAPALARSCAHAVQEALAGWGRLHLAPRCQPPERVVLPSSYVVSAAAETDAVRWRNTAQVLDLVLRLYEVADGRREAASFENADVHAAAVVIELASALGLAATCGPRYSAAWPAVHNEGPADRTTVYVARRGRDVAAISTWTDRYGQQMEPLARAELLTSLGAAYGYPACCVAQFAAWEACQLRAAYFPAVALATEGRWLGGTNKRPPGSPVQHVPCSFACSATARRSAAAWLGMADPNRTISLLAPFAAAGRLGLLTEAAVHAAAAIAAGPEATALYAAPLLYADWRRYVCWPGGRVVVGADGRARVEGGVALPAAVLVGDAATVAEAFANDGQLAAWTMQAETQGRLLPAQAPQDAKVWLLPFDAQTPPR